MRAAPIATCLWPGLSRLWLRGEWQALLVAVAYGVALNSALVGSLVWPELAGPIFPLLAWPLVVGIWIVSVWRSYRSLPSLSVRRVETNQTDSSDEPLYAQAQIEYLRGHWFEAEKALNSLLRIRPADVEARIMLATLCRHTRRFDDAERQLKMLDRHDGAEIWRFEIMRERQALQRLAEETTIVSNEEHDDIIAAEPQDRLSKAA